MKIAVMFLFAWYFIYTDHTSANYGPTTYRIGPFATSAQCYYIRGQMVPTTANFSARLWATGCWEEPQVQPEKKNNR